jgi:F-type H+-transporting ATPase subunit a
MAENFTFARLKNAFQISAMPFAKSPFLLAFLLFAATLANAQHEGHQAHEHHSTTDTAHQATADAHDTHPDAAQPTDLRTQINEDIKHHLMDSHDYHLTNTADGHPIGFPLPVILWDGGMQIFMSSKFNHGHAVAESNGNYYTLYHGKIYKTDAAGNLTMDEHGHPTNAKPLDFSITKNVFHIIVISLLILWMFVKAARSYKNSPVPSGAAKFFEPIILFVRDEIAIPNIGEKYYARYMNYLLTVFFFIWIVNLFGLTPLGVNITNSIAVTFALALITFLITQFSGKKEYWMHIFWMPGVPWPMKILLAPIELLGIFIKPFALMIRLYANITAGHVVLMSIIGLMFIFKSWIGSPLSFGLAFALSLLELLVAALQAYIFTMLSALYFGSAVAEHEHEHGHEHH